MYDFGKLWHTALPGLWHLVTLPMHSRLPPDALHLRLVLWGNFPRVGLAAVAAACLGIGVLLSTVTLELWFDLWQRVRWGPGLFGLLVAVRLRLRVAAIECTDAGAGFCGAFGPVAIVALALAVADSLVDAALATRGVFAPAAEGAALAVAALEFGGDVLAAGTATAFVIAAFGYTRSYVWAFVSVLGAFVLFLLTVALLEILVLGLGPFRSLFQLVVYLVAGATLSDRTLQLIDRTAFTVFFAGICLPILGSLWWQARDNFARMLAGDDVEIVAAIESEAEADSE